MEVIKIHKVQAGDMFKREDGSRIVLVCNSWISKQMFLLGQNFELLHYISEGSTYFDMCERGWVHVGRLQDLKMSGGD